MGINLKIGSDLLKPAKKIRVILLVESSYIVAKEGDYTSVYFSP